MSNSQKDLLYTVALAFFLLTAAITITIFASYPLFAFDIKHYNLDQIVEMKYGTIMKNYMQMMDYLKNKASVYPKSAEKICYMMRRFEEDGFTSYWL